MALYATNRFPGDGTKTSYEFNFVGKYIDRAHVKAYIEDGATGVRVPVPLTDSNFLNDTTLKNLPPTPVGSTLVIYRDTPRYPLADFSSGSRITEESLDAVARQGIFVAAEAADAGDLGTNPASIVNVGVGNKLVAGETAGVTRMRTLAAGTNISITETPETLVISSTGGSGASGASTPLRVAVIGDSLSAQQVLLGEAWPAILQRQLAAGGYDVTVHNLAINGYTFNKAATIQSFGGRTQVAQAIELNPDVVIVALGFNDSMLKVEGRDLNTLKVDAANVFASLRTNLPAATIVYASEVSYDSTHAFAVTLLNKQTIPFLMQRRSTGLLAGVACSEILNDATSATTRWRLAEWSELDTYVKGLATVDGNFSLHVWKASRLGLSGTDGLHLTDMGAHFLAGQARKAFTTVPALTSKAPWLSDQNYVWFMDSDNLFSSLVESNGTEYVGRPWAANSEHSVRNYGPYRVCNPHTWHLPTKGSYFSSSLNYTQGSQFLWSLTNVTPTAEVFASINGGAWASVGNTNSYGDFHASEVLHPAVFPVGTHTARYKIGEEVHGPVSLVVNASGGGATYVLPVATASELGGVKVGNNLTMTNGVLSVPVGSGSSLGVVQPGAGLAVAGAGVVSVPLASDSVAGRVKPGTGLVMGTDGALDAKLATSSTPGIVRPGTGLSVAADGTLNASGSGSGEEAWAALTLTGGHSWWSGQTGYYRKVGNTVQLRGAIQLAATGPQSDVQLTMALPLTHRPPGSSICGMAAAAGANKTAAVTISNTQGTLQGSVNADAGTNGIIFLDGINYHTN